MISLSIRASTFFVTTILLLCIAAGAIRSPAFGPSPTDPTSDAGETYLRRIPTLQRLHIHQLKATHEDVERLRQTYKPLLVADGWLDLRAAIHVHSHLSHDSRGTLGDLIKGAKESRVKVLMMTEHPSSHHDVLALGFRGTHEGILFIPGVEEQNLLTFPTQLRHDTRSMSRQQRIHFVARQPSGLVFVAHPEEITDWSFNDFHGMEIYNTHADVKDEPELQKLLTEDVGFDVVAKLWEAFKFFPSESFACITDPQTQVLKQWDALTQKRRVVGIAANDSHENVRFVLKKKSDNYVEIFDFYGHSRGVLDARTDLPLLPTPLRHKMLQLLRQSKVGERLMSATLDPYERSFHYVSTHILAREQSEAAVRESLAAGRCYVAFDWIADPTGTYFRATGGKRSAMMGEEIKFSPDLALEFGTTLEVCFRVLENGKVTHSGVGRSAHIPVARRGVYRVELWVSIGGEDRPWVYTNPIYVR